MEEKENEVFEAMPEEIKMKNCMICLRINNLCQMQFVCCHGKTSSLARLAFLSFLFCTIQKYFPCFSCAHLKCFPNKYEYTYNALKRYEIFDDCRKCLLKVPDGNVNGWKLRSKEIQYVK